MFNFKHSGGLGDIIYSLPLIRHLGGGQLYIPRRSETHPNQTCPDQFEFMCDLETVAPYVRPRLAGALEIFPDQCFNLDQFRGFADFDRKLPEAYFVAARQRNMCANVPDNWKQQWLRRPGPPVTPGYALFQRTSRYQDPSLDWVKIVSEAAEKHNGRLYFIGLVEEWIEFLDVVKLDKIYMAFAPTVQIMASWVVGAGMLYCNQSIALTLAQGMGTPYSLEVAPGFNSCVLGLPNERLLNR